MKILPLGPGQQAQQQQPLLVPDRPPDDPADEVLFIRGRLPESLKPTPREAPAPRASFPPPRFLEVTDPLLLAHRTTQVELLNELGNAELQYTDEPRMEKGRMPSVSELEHISAALYENSRIPFEFIQEGCYARAHLMCESLRQQGIYCQKIFVFGEDLRAANQVQPDARWYFHVAPLIYVQDPLTGVVEARVLDPGLSREPLTCAEFVRRINPGGGPVRVDLVDDAQYLPREDYGRQDDFAANLGKAVRETRAYARSLKSIVPDDWSGPVRGGQMDRGNITSEDPLFPEGIAYKPSLGERIGKVWRELLGRPDPDDY